MTQLAILALTKAMNSPVRLITGRTCARTWRRHTSHCALSVGTIKPALPNPLVLYTPYQFLMTIEEDGKDTILTMTDIVGTDIHITGTHSMYTTPWYSLMNNTVKTA
jgi:hypothetical protein